MLVRALCMVKLTASDRSWPHMRAAGRSRFAPRIGHHRGCRAGTWRGSISGGRSRIRTGDGSLTSGQTGWRPRQARDQNRSRAGLFSEGVCHAASLAHSRCRTMLAQMGPQVGSSGKSGKRPSGMSDTVKGAIIGALGVVVAAVLTATIGHSAGVVYIGTLPSPSQVPSTGSLNPTGPASAATVGATAPQSSSAVKAATPLYTAPFTVHGPNASTCNTWVYVEFSAAGPVVNAGGGTDLDFDCSDSGVPEVRPESGVAFAAVPSKPDAPTCVRATQRDPLSALALRDMTSHMWLCVDDGSLVTAMQLQTPPSQAATTGVVKFTASSWPA